MPNSLNATDPRTSATVSASAGTGKTWLLVTRLIRLLLADARPEGILAVTFTRKAAAEMQTRLNERLLEMAHCSDLELENLLTKIDVPADENTRQKARTLYESLLSSPHTIRTSTFHSFCQDILRKFPMEAGIAPGFELQEATEDLKQDAWNAICAKASANPDSEIACTLETLIDVCDGLTNATTAINSFLDHRSDWWAFTEGQQNPLAFTIETLTSQLNISPGVNPQQEFFSETILGFLEEFISLLEKHPGKKNDVSRDALLIASDPSCDLQLRFVSATKAFLTQKGDPLKRKENKTQADKMGEKGQQRFLAIHDMVCDAIANTLDQINTLNAYHRIRTWYQAGSEALNQYQQLKRELRVLDFSDLEWLAYLLLNHSNNVHWIQYKLDQRIDHLLVDEFQDTNPTQWRLILPLLEELAASGNERQRSVFLVGDNKQSIYRFRRADPELFDAAQDWLKNNLQAISQPLDTSWRSADAIMSFVNQVFESGPLNERLPHFSRHTTHHQDLWGRVELLPLIEPRQQDNHESDQETSTEFRNPLNTPLLLDRDQSHLEEGQLIASRINDLINEKTLIGDINHSRPIRYSDIIILIRNRTNVADYEQALREAGIPYAGADRGTLLNSLEINDLVNLLELLITPFNNLALANVLRSPIFNCTNEDLINLSQQKESNWIDKLSILASIFETDKKSCSVNLHRAHTLLERWRELVGILPVHDLLDRIYSEGDLINRYRAGYPPHLQHSVTANLTRFIELALEIDSGRHPTVGRFVSRLNSLRQQDKEAPDEGSPIQADSRVRIMTIHASKGLEAPVVFLADASFSSSDKNAYRTVVDWPASEHRPNCFLLAGKKDSRDRFTTDILGQHALAEAREDANLLYVAITRARQLLYISGCQPKRGKDLGWYGLIYDQCLNEATNTLLTFESGKYPKSSQEKIPDKAATPSVEPQLSQPLKRQEKEFIIAPSYQTGTLNQLSRDNEELEVEFLHEDARTRGIAIHRCLQLLCDNKFVPKDATELIHHVSSELSIESDDIDLETCVSESINVFTHSGLTQVFDNKQYESSYNEVPVQYFKNDQMVYGIIDRLVVTDSEIWVIDYKTHRLPDSAQEVRIREQYRPQIELYCLGANKLWPKKRTRGFLLLTHTAELLDLGL